MTAIHETAYPRIRSNLTDKELRELYTPTTDDLAFIHDATKSVVTCPSRKPEGVRILDFFFSRPHLGPMCFRSFSSPS
jgi:hypothetical protein